MIQYRRIEKKMSKKLKTKQEIIRISGKLKEVVFVRDEKGNLLHKIISPLMVEFYARDVIQVMIGASILAIPIAFTEETWRLGESLPWINVLGIMTLSLLFISIFVYYNFYKSEHIRKHLDEFIKRILSTYIISFVIVALILTLIQRAPWSTDLPLTIKRIILVAFPASMSAAVADMIK